MTMMVNDNANIKFQLDCGATCNLLPLKDYARVVGDPDASILRRVRPS